MDFIYVPFVNSYIPRKGECDTSCKHFILSKMIYFSHILKLGSILLMAYARQFKLSKRSLQQIQ